MPAQQRKRAATKPLATGGPVEPGQVVTISDGPDGFIRFQSTAACPECFPGGRLPAGARSGGCEHGTWPAPQG
jgi:hypothetical protein